MRKSATVIALPVALLAISGCTSVSDGFVAREWTGNMRELGINPLFPPRADVRVGDIFVSPADDSNGQSLTPMGFATLGVYFASLDVTSQLNDHYKNRTVFAASPVSAASAEAAAAAPPVQAAASAPARKASQPEVSAGFQLRPVAFPMFLRATASGAEVGALIPIDSQSLKAGFNANSVKSASVTISSAESYSIPWVKLQDMLTSTKGSEPAIFSGTAGVVPDQTIQFLRAAAGLKDESAAPIVDVTVINEVFYARSFDVTFQLSNEAALAIAKAAGTDSTDTTTKQADAAPKPSTSASEVAEAKAESAVNLAAKEELKRQASLEAAKSRLPSIAGVTSGVSYSSSGTVGLRTSFDTPIAVGYRGVTIRVNLESKKWTSAALPSSNVLLTSDKVKILGLRNPAAKASAPGQ